MAPCRQCGLPKEDHWFVYPDRSGCTESNCSGYEEGDSTTGE